MPKHSFEIEIKSLLGNKSAANDLVEKMQKADPNLQILGTHKQLNHYFEGGSLKKLYDKVVDMLSEEEKHKLDDLAKHAKTFSVRTRDADGKIILVVKATADDTTSENGTARIEFEATPRAGEGDGKLMTIDNLDKLILSAGFSYQAKWSRARQEFIFRGLDVSIDKNAGYGYLAEFEKVLEDESQAEDAKRLIRELMKELGAKELPQDRLQRMFDFYNNNWQDYYGTEKTFNIK